LATSWQQQSNPLTRWVVRRRSIGQQLDLVYNPAKPDQVWIDAWHEVWFGAILLWGVSAVLLFGPMVG